jgi:hypothetical protein
MPDDVPTETIYPAMPGSGLASQLSWAVAAYAKVVRTRRNTDNAMRRLSRVMSFFSLASRDWHSRRGSGPPPRMPTLSTPIGPTIAIAKEQGRYRGGYPRCSSNFCGRLPVHTISRHITLPLCKAIYKNGKQSRRRIGDHQDRRNCDVIKESSRSGREDVRDSAEVRR